MSTRAPFFICWATFCLVLGCGKMGKKVHPPAASSHGAQGGAGGMNAAGSSTEGGAPDGEGGGKAGLASAAAGAGGHAGTATTGTGGGGMAAQGGAPLGGAPAAGAPAAGSTAAGAPSFAVPAGCTPGTQHVSDAQCSSDMTCDSDRVVVACNPDDQGLWWCSCLLGPDRTNLYFPDTTGTRTCEVAATACLHPELLTGEEVCKLSSATLQNGELSVCTAVDGCQREHSVDGVKVVTKSDWTASCQTSGYLDSSCTCPPSFSANRWVATTDLSGGCDFVEALCKDDMPMPTGDWRCDPEFEEAYPGSGCHSYTDCKRPIKLSDGTAIDQAEFINVNCGIDGTHTRCSCQGVSGQLKYSMAIGIAGDQLAACRIVSDACADIEPPALMGSPECTATSDEAGPKSCTRSLDCTQMATTAGTGVTLFTQVGVTCTLPDAGAWSCTCQASADPSFDVDADDSASACDQGIAKCPSQATY